MNRRTFLAGAAASTSNPLSMTFKNSLSRSGIRGMAFDAFPIFDPRSISASCERMFGYRTCWNNRPGAPEERLDVTPDARGATLADLAGYLEEFLPSRE